MPNKILTQETMALRAGLFFFRYRESHYRYMENLMLDGWAFYAVDQKRGRCYYQQKEITIPFWVIEREKIKPGRCAAYILHEISHALVLKCYGWHRAIGIDHGKEFMEILIEITPPELLIYEMTYKPKNLVKAGARFCPDSLEF